MKNYGRASLDEFLGDRVVYRNLVPLDSRLPSLDAVRAHLKLPAGRIPRKTDREYGMVIAHLLGQARTLDAPGQAIEWLIYIGDTRMNDGTAFANICRSGGWRGLAFIASERDELPRVEIHEDEVGTLYVANCWSALADFAFSCGASGCPIDERAAVVIDMDKTALGARGRNDHVIDLARIEAVHRTARELLGDAFDAQAFQAAYSQLNQPEFHPFTADNQDYLTYICLVLASGLYSLQPLLADVRAGRMPTFERFIDQVDGRSEGLPAGLRSIHQQVYALVRQGDPTPFKAFRYHEYRTTVGRMGYLPDETPVSRLLAEEIVVTQEVRQSALEWRKGGALLFGLSDKPDEASIPGPDLAAKGYHPIHRTLTHVVGS